MFRLKNERRKDRLHMKKIWMILLAGLLIVFTGCAPNNNPSIIEVPEGIYLTMGEFYVLEGFETYAIEDETIASVTNGIIYALKSGETSLSVTYQGETFTVAIVIASPDWRDLVVDVIDIGQGDAILIQLPNYENLMIDVGKDKSDSWTQINAVLEAYDIDTIHHLIITHNHADHYDLVPTLLDNYTVEAVYTSGSTRTNIGYLSVIEAIANKGLDIYVVSVGDKIIDEVGLMLQVVATQQIENETNPNISSVVVKLTYMENAFMFTGDAGVASSRDGEYTALASGIDLKSDVLKVGHHGSIDSCSAEFLSAVAPDYAVMTTRVGGVGLPHPTTVARIEAVNATLYDSKVHGNVTFISNGHTITITTQRG